MIFKNADKEDFGVYSVSVTNTDGVSSSYGISSEGKIYAETQLGPNCKQVFTAESARLFTDVSVLWFTDKVIFTVH